MTHSVVLYDTGVLTQPGGHKNNTAATLSVIISVSLGDFLLTSRTSHTGGNEPSVYVDDTNHLFGREVEKWLHLKRHNNLS